MNKSGDPIIVFWFRRDLRLHDNRGLYEALSRDKPVLPIFIFDDDIVDVLPGNDHRLTFIYDSLRVMQQQLQHMGRGLLIERGKPPEVFSKLLSTYNVHAVYCNKDHEPYGISRDSKIKAFLQGKGVGFNSWLDHLIFDKNEILKQDATPYQVFTPYSRAWTQKLDESMLSGFPSEKLLKNLVAHNGVEFPQMKQLGLIPSALKPQALQFSNEHISEYHIHRDFPERDATTRLGVYLRFGTTSIRHCVGKALRLNQVLLNELIWREFYAMILWHYPQVMKHSFKSAYDRIPWLNDEADFEKWKNGTTGFPMVDAGMRQLKETGYMHNRLRMITASFLSKHLLIDWRWGEAWFAEKLFDYELSSNNGGWQWSAGTGCDAAPYFRVFNPTAQQKKFDPDGSFIRQWVAEINTSGYPVPMVDHAAARNRCLKVYKDALGKG